MCPRPFFAVMVASVLAVGCAPPAVPVTSVEAAVKTYACAVVRASRDFQSLAQGTAPSTAGASLPGGPSKVTIELSTSLAKEGSVGSGTLIPLSLTAKATDTRSTTVTIELARLPTIQECDALRTKKVPEGMLDQETGKLVDTSSADKQLLLGQ